MSSDPPLRSSVAADLGSLAEAFAAGRRPELPAGTVVGGHFAIEALLGQGGMGVVYRARDLNLGRVVAVKLDARAGDVARARREAEALARLAHPNVLTVHEVGEHDGVPFVAMELCEGGNARTWLAGGRRDWREIVRVYAEAGRGLAAAHAAGLIHRDVKPDNILLGADGRARIGDFGLAQDAGQAAAGGSAGTPRYMAPEQQHGGVADARADQFAFCVALYEALAGVDPFPPLPDERLAAIADRRMAAPRAGRALPRAVHAVLARGLALAPERRFPDMDALGAALARATRRSRGWIVGAIAVASAAAAAMIAWPRRPAPRPRPGSPPTGHADPCVTLAG